MSLYFSRYPVHLSYISIISPWLCLCLFPTHHPSLYYSVFAHSPSTSNPLMPSFVRFSSSSLILSPSPSLTLTFIPLLTLWPLEPGIPGMPGGPLGPDVPGKPRGPGSPSRPSSPCRTEYMVLEIYYIASTMEIQRISIPYWQTHTTRIEENNDTSMTIIYDNFLHLCRRFLMLLEVL